MLSVDEMKDILNSLYKKQGDRLIASNEPFEQFLNRPEEEAVTFEIDCYEALIEDAANARS
jgi:hypothetical protein